MMERTLAIIKPDGVQRGLVGKIIERYEAAGFKIVAMKMMKASPELLKRHYPDSMAYEVGMKSAKAGEKAAEKDPTGWGMKVLGWLRNFMSSGPVVPIVLEGEDVIKKAREVTGFTDPSQATKGTVRGDYGQDSILKANSEGRPVRNLVHMSGNPEEAKKEIGIWFSSSELK